MPPILPHKWLFALVVLSVSVSHVHSYAGILVVTIERVVALSDFDRTCTPFGCIGSAADFYAIVNLDGKESSSKDSYVSDQDDISPNWRFSKAVDLSKASIPVSIQIYDLDGGLRFDDDVAHINPQGGDSLPLQVIPSSPAPPTGCQISGPISGGCGDHLVTRGNSGDRAELTFRIEIFDPASFPFLDWDVVPADPAVSGSFDPNHLLVNARWGWQTKTVSSPPNFDDCSSVEVCTQQFPVKDYPDWSIPFVCHSNILGRNGDGHLNWEVVTYKGQIHWDGHESPTFGDDDYNFGLDTPITNGFGSGGTKKNPNQLHLEMKASETIDHFGNTPYWKRFRDAVDNDDHDPLNVGGSEAIAIGLLGLDRVHPPSGSELHPLYALAIHTQTDLSDDRWAIFARNFGNEGMCSDQMHYADFRTLTFQLPRPAGVASTVKPILLFRDFWGNNPDAMDVFTGPGQDTFVTFHMNPTPNNGDDGDRISGELHLRWVGPGTRRSTPPQFEHPDNETSTYRLLVERADDEGDPEAILEKFFNSLTADQQETYRAMFPPPPPPSNDVHQKAVNFLTGKPPPVTTKPRLAAAKNPLQEQRQRAILNSFCGSLGGQLPADHPGSCTDYPPFTRLVHTGQPHANGWYTDPVTITLIGINANGKGIDHTEYQIGSQNLVRYSSPFPLPQGVSTVFYRSQDRAGTFEPTKEATFRVDTLLPQSFLTIGLPQYDAGPPVVISSQTPLTLTGTDSGSGVASVSYRFFRDGTPLVSYKTTPGSSVEFKIIGADAIYRVDTLVTDVAGNRLEQRQKIHLSNSADLAIVSLAVVSPPPPFVVVGTPIQLLVRTVLVNLGLVHPVDGILNRKVLDTADVTLTPKDVTQTETALERNQQRVRDQTYTVACVEKRSTNSVTFTSKIELSAGLPGITDNDPSNNQKSLTIQVLCKVPWRPGVTYRVGDEVVFNGLVYVARQSHTAQVGWEPPRTYALWARIPVADEWAPQVIYQTGDVVVFAGHHYKAVQGHQALDVWTPPSVLALWVRLD